MEKIQNNTSEPGSVKKSYDQQLEERIFSTETKKKKLRKGLIGYAGIAVSVILLFVSIVAVTSDITINSFADWAALSVQFFVLLFCAYMVYVSCADSGKRAGAVSDGYIATVKKYDDVKNRVAEGRMQSRIAEFCRWYIIDELRHVRENILIEVGIEYDEYKEKYIGKDKEYINGLGSLTKSEKDAVIRANATKPITLTPEMMLRRGRGSGRRGPLGTPKRKAEMANYRRKFISTTIISLMLGVFTVQLVSEPTLDTVVNVLMKTVMIIMNAFSGYRMGYSNIVITDAEYIEDQTDLMNKLEIYVSENPLDQRLGTN